jgi:lipopolysaccharide transport system permease protein
MSQSLYSPDSHPAPRFQLIRETITSILASRELASQLLVRNLRAHYRQSLLGYLWLLLTPLATAVIWIFLRAARIVSFPASTVPYAVYVVTGLFLWQGFLRMLNMPLSQLNMSRSILVRVKIPWEAILMAGIGEVLFEFALYLVILLGVFIGFGIQFQWTMLLGLGAVFIWLLSAFAIGLLATPWGMLYDDISRGINVTTSLLFFLIPIVYSTPTAFPGTLLVGLNPAAILFVTTRDLLMTGHTTYGIHFLIVTILVGGLFVASWVIFRLAIPHLIARLAN